MDIVEARTFLGSVLGDEGNYCLWCYNSKDKYDITQEFYSSIEELLVRSTELDSNKHNVFFALGTFKEPTNRKQINVQQLKSFFMDLDCGPSKDFPTQADAVEALRRFCKTNKLPRPTMVNSGNGIHVYWPLVKPVDEATWWPVAERLKQLCAAQNFPADPSCTSDSARILRIPNTHNHKTDEPKPVNLLHGFLAEPIEFDEFEKCLGGGVIPVPDKFTPSAHYNAINEQATGSFKRLLEKTKQGTGCAQIAYIIKNQDTISYDLWRGALSIAKVCTDAEKAVRNISKRHPEYDFNEAMRKMADTGGPQYCSTFAKHNPDGCAGCPNTLTITTPAQLTKIVEEAEPTPEIPKYPTPYMRGKHGGVYMKSKDEEGNPIELPIYHHDLYVTHRLDDPEQGEVLAFALHLPNDGVRRFTVPLVALTSREDFRKSMAVKGITSYGDDLGKLMKYIQTWVNELQQTGAADRAHTQFGWVDDEKMDAFVWGDKLIKADSIEYNPPSAKTAFAMEWLKPKGSLERQKEIMSFFNREGLELHQFVVCMGFASPLMSLTGLFSFQAHLNGGSGVGKTTALYSNTGIWGKPVKLCSGSDDSMYSHMNRLERWKNMVGNLDEKSNVTAKEVSSYCYTGAEGQQRNRLKSSGNEERYRGDPWRMSSCSTGNISYWELLQRTKANPEAEMQRVLEFNVAKYMDKHRMAEMNKKEGLPTTITGKLFDDVQKNYGNFTVDYVQHIINHRADIEKLYVGIKQKLDKAASLTPVNRFFSAGCTNVIVGCILGNRLGIIDYDYKKLFDWIVKELIRAKSEIEDTAPSVSNIVADFAREHWGNILKIKSTDDAREEVASLVVPENNPRMRLVGRYETDTKLLFIPTKDFKTFLTDQFLTYSSTVKGLKEDMGATQRNVRLTKGTSLNLPAQYCLVVKMEGLDETPTT